MQRAFRNDGWDRQEDRTSGRKIDRPTNGQNKETRYEKKKQFQSRTGHFCKNNRFNFKKGDFNKDYQGQRNENRNRSGEPKRGQDKTEMRNVRGRWAPREESARERISLVPKYPKCQKMHSGEC